MAMKKKAEEHAVSKFHAGDYDVKIQYPAHRSWNTIQRIIDRHPPGRSSLASVSSALAKVGAAFVPWQDRKPGYSGAYR